MNKQKKNMSEKGGRGEGRGGGGRGEEGRRRGGEGIEVCVWAPHYLRAQILTYPLLHITDPPYHYLLSSHYSLLSGLSDKGKM